MFKLPLFKNNIKNHLTCLLIATSQITFAIIRPESTNTPEKADQKNLITINFYNNPNCQGEIIAQRKIYTKNCFAWERKTKTRTVRKNSANHFQCFQDRLCYTQYPMSDNCKATPSSFFAHKQFKTTCTKEAQGQLWSKITSGTEQCPKAPNDFQCPQQSAQKPNFLQYNLILLKEYVNNL